MTLGVDAQTGNSLY